MINRARSNRWIFAMICSAAVAPGLSIAQLSSPTNTAQASVMDTTRPEGIWKAAVPAHAMRGQFDNFDPLGVAAGVKIKADCSLNWISPDSGKLYCFASGTSLEYFLDRPQANIQRARNGWLRMTSKRD